MLILWAGEWVVQNFIRGGRDQLMLLPVDMREWLPEDDIVWASPLRVDTGHAARVAGCRAVVSKSTGVSMPIAECRRRRL